MGNPLSYISYIFLKEHNLNLCKAPKNTNFVGFSGKFIIYTVQEIFYKI